MGAVKWGTEDKQTGKHHEKRRGENIRQISGLLTIPAMASGFDLAVETSGSKKLIIEKSSVFFMARFSTSK